MSGIKELLFFRNTEKIPVDPFKYIEHASKAFAQDVVKSGGGVAEINNGIDRLGLLPIDTIAWYLDLQTTRIAKGFAGR
jgi:hypothetical protein